MRIPRRFSVCAGFAVHKVWRGHNKEPNLQRADQKAAYLEFLNEDFESLRFRTGSKLQALSLMSNHAHEIFKIENPKQFSGHMRRHHSRYGMYFNKQNGRCGKVAQDRPRTCLINDAHNEMQTVFYVHANPVKANITGDARNYHWTTHRLYAFGMREEWMRNISLPDWYLSLGPNSAARQKKYRQLFAQYLKQHRLLKDEVFHRPFFGPDEWIELKMDEVRAWRRDHAPPNPPTCL